MAYGKVPVWPQTKSVTHIEEREGDFAHIVYMKLYAGVLGKSFSHWFCFPLGGKKRSNSCMVNQNNINYLERANRHPHY